ncbi:hypothetical protein PR048_024951 [Dryococelus australis]|uniref:Uncharacterized protein n=1 Tax=Dryococelus australis TaxID=614101 RepID=A0ABQ9GQ01_9NEOP|nr:hypothetical protein PR048_024951 [Dryococelus australis]
MSARIRTHDIPHAWQACYNKTLISGDSLEGCYHTSTFIFSPASETSPTPSGQLNPEDSDLFSLRIKYARFSPMIAGYPARRSAHLAEPGSRFSYVGRGSKCRTPSFNFLESLEFSSTNAMSLLHPRISLHVALERLSCTYGHLLRSLSVRSAPREEAAVGDALRTSDLERFSKLKIAVATEQLIQSEKFGKRNTMLDYTRQKAKLKYINRIRLERASQKQSSDTHKTPYDRVKRCRERKINKAYERVNVDVFTQNERPCPQLSHTPDTHKTPCNLVKRCRERKINIKASERVNLTNGRDVAAEYPHRWIGRVGPIPWPTCSPDLSPLDCLKNSVYSGQWLDTRGQLLQAITDSTNQLGIELAGMQWQHDMVGYNVSQYAYASTVSSCKDSRDEFFFRFNSSLIHQALQVRRVELGEVRRSSWPSSGSPTANPLFIASAVQMISDFTK